MNKNIGLIIIISFLLSGCRYKEGPLISFRSVEKRMQGDWKVVKFSADGIDSTNYYNDSIGGYIYINFPFDELKYTICNRQGKRGWGGSFTFSKNREIMNVYFSQTLFKGVGPICVYGKTQWKILKLTKEELKMSVNFYQKNYIILLNR